jgi:hypothetical protein
VTELALYDSDNGATFMNKCTIFLGVLLWAAPVATQDELNRRTARTLVLEGHHAEQDGNLDEAITKYQQAYDVFPDNDDRTRCSAKPSKPAAGSAKRRSATYGQDSSP